MRHGWRIDARLAKHFWLVRASTIVACSALAATTASHLIEARALADRDRPIRRPVVRPPSVASDDGSRRLARALVARNIFCSGCEPPVAVDRPAMTPSGEPLATALPLRLVATSISLVEAGSFATIRNTTSAMQGAYAVGDHIPGAGAVVRIHPRHVDFENEASHVVERIPIFTGEAPRAAAPAPPPPAVARPRGSRDALLAAVDAGVRDMGDGRFEVDRALVTQLLANPSAAARGARVVPSVKDGKPNGFKLYAVRKLQERRHHPRDQRLRADQHGQGARGLHQAARVEQPVGGDDPPRQADEPELLDPLTRCRSPIAPRPRREPPAGGDPTSPSKCDMPVLA
jgi:general secretion pathway protein C